MPGAIAIVGGGVSGLSSLHRLLTHITINNVVECQEEIHLFEEETKVGGPAWSDLNSEVHLFNFPAGVAALELNDYSGKFLRWCAENGHTEVGFGSYPPRHLFGAYCTYFLQKTQTLAIEKGISLVVHSNSSVTDIQRVNETQMRILWTDLSIGNHGGVELVVDAALLCTGPAAPENDVLAPLRGCPGYVSSPWPHPEHIPAAASVAIIGTGLSAVDTAKQLYGRAGGHSGPVVLASRRGLLPTIKAARHDPFLPLSVATPEAVQAVVAEHGHGAVGLLALYMDMIRQEMAAFQSGAPEGAAVSIADFDACFLAAMSEGPRNGVRELEKHLAASRLGGGLRLPWQDCLIALAIKDVVRDMWDTLCDAEKHIFQAKYSTLLNIHFNSMPASSGEDVLGYLQSTEKECSLRGALHSTEAVSVAKGEGEGEGEGRGGFLLQFSDSSPPVQVDYVINAMGFGKHFTSTSTCTSRMSPLYRHMCARGDLVEPCVFGGLVSDFRTGRLMLGKKKKSKEEEEEEEGEEGGAGPLLYGVGHIISGTKMMTSGVGFCLIDGAAAVDDMLEQLQRKKK